MNLTPFFMMLRQHSDISVLHSLNYLLNQTYGTPGG